jgi:hypothetical protein
VSVDIHRRVESLVAQAEQLAAQGQHDEARRIYLDAANLEAEVFRAIPTSRPRTRGIIAVSVVSLFWRAGAQEEVARYGRECLAQPELPEFARNQINDLLANRDPMRSVVDPNDDAGSAPDERPQHTSKRPGTRELGAEISPR